MAQNIMEGASQSETKQSDKQSNVKKTIQTFLEDSYVPVRQRTQQKIRKIFRDFSFSSITFHLFLLNCLSWFSVNLIFYFSKIEEWQCVQFAFFAKFQPSITYNYQFWRLLLSSVMFRGWIQFYFNNFALNMLGYVIEKQSRAKFVLIFYGGILAGHMLSCCLSSPSQLTVGTSCGTIALLPCEICRFIKLKQTNPIQARSRRNFLIFNILSNFILNVQHKPQTSRQPVTTIPQNPHKTATQTPTDLSHLHKQQVQHKQTGQIHIIPIKNPGDRILIVKETRSGRGAVSVWWLLGWFVLLFCSLWEVSAGSWCWWMFAGWLVGYLVLFFVQLMHRIAGTLNVLAIFHLDAVDWISHIGCLIAGCFFLVFYELKPKSTGSQERAARIKSMIVRYGSMALLFGFYLSMALIIWIHLPRLGIGKKQLQKMNFECYKNI